MSEEQQNAQTPNDPGTATGNTQAAVGRTFTQADLDRIAGQAREEGRKAAQAEADRKRLEEQQEYKALYEKALADAKALEPFKQQAESAQASIKALVEAEIAALPEDVRGMVPDFGDSKKTLEWITANKARLTRQPAPGTDAGARGDSLAAVKLTPGQQAAARAAGMSNEDYIKVLVQMGQLKKE